MGNNSNGHRVMDRRGPPGQAPQPTLSPADKTHLATLTLYHYAPAVARFKKE
jgi:hypothetical protein